MKTPTLETLIASMNAEAATLHAHVRGSVPAGVTIDSRSVVKGDIFFALKGERSDGATYVPAAIEKGAVLAVVNKSSADPSFDGLPVVYVPDTVIALGDAARTVRDAFEGACRGGDRHER